MSLLDCFLTHCVQFQTGCQYLFAAIEVVLLAVSLSLKSHIHGTIVNSLDVIMLKSIS